MRSHIQNLCSQCTSQPLHEPQIAHFCSGHLLMWTCMCACVCEKTRKINHGRLVMIFHAMWITWSSNLSRHNKTSLDVLLRLEGHVFLAVLETMISRMAFVLTQNIFTAAFPHLQLYMSPIWSCNEGQPCLLIRKVSYHLILVHCSARSSGTLCHTAQRMLKSPAKMVTGMGSAWLLF